MSAESTWLSLRNSFRRSPWHWRTRLLLSAVTFFVNFNSRASICHGVPHKPSNFVASHAMLCVCLVPFFCLAQPRSWWCTKLLVFDRDDRQRFLESCGLQMNRHHLLQLDGTKLFSKLRHWISPSSYSSYQFARFSFHANSHLVHDLRCKTVKPAG